MSNAPLSTNWLDQFKLRLACGNPATGPNSSLETLNGILALKIEEALIKFPTLLDDDTDQPRLIDTYNKIICGDLLSYESLVYIELARLQLKLNAAGDAGGFGAQGAAIANLSALLSYTGSDTVNKANIVTDIGLIRTKLNLLLASLRTSGIIAP